MPKPKIFRLPFTPSYEFKYGRIDDALAEKNAERTYMVARGAWGLIPNAITLTDPRFSQTQFSGMDNSGWAQSTGTILFEFFYPAENSNNYLITVSVIESWNGTNTEVLYSLALCYQFLGADSSSGGNLSAYITPLTTTGAPFQLMQSIVQLPGFGYYANVFDNTTPGNAYAVGDLVMILDPSGTSFVAQIKVTALVGNSGIAAFTVLETWMSIFNLGNATLQTVAMTGAGSGAIFYVAQGNMFVMPAIMVQMQGADDSQWMQIYGVVLPNILGLNGPFVDYLPNNGYVKGSGSLPPYASLVSGILAPKTLTVFNDYALYLDASGLLWNSNAGVYGIFNGLSFLQAFTNPASVPVALAVHAGYLLAFSQLEIRAFIVTGATNGSAFAPALNVNINVGALNADCVCSLNDVLCFVGNPDNAGIAVYAFVGQTLAPLRLTTPWLENYLSSQVIINARMFMHRGHLCLRLSFQQGFSFVYDFTTKLWYRWTSKQLGEAHFSYVLGMEFPQILTCNQDTDLVSLGTATYALSRDTKQPVGTNGYFMFAALGPPGLDLITAYSSTSPYFAYTPTLTTIASDNGATVQKSFQSATLVGDYAPGAFFCTLSYTNDNTTFSTPRTIDMNSTHPVARNLGVGRRRSWQVTFPPQWGVAIEALEIAFNISET